MAESRRQRKERWFDAAEAALGRITGAPAPGYVCPLCLGICTTLDHVSFEHAPPKSVGGGEVALTCRDCNSIAGYGIDNELRKAHEVREWNRRQLGRPLRARFTIGGVPLNVDVEWDQDSMKIVGIPELNDPANTAAHTETMDRLAATGETDWSFQVRLPHHSYIERQARVAWLRSAYIAAFAVFGYSYVLREELQIVRSQIENPGEEIIDRFSLHRREPMTRRVVLVTKSPRSLESVAVQIDDHHLVFLPGLKAGPSIYERLAARKIWPPHRRTFRNVDALHLGWPSQPVHLFDDR